MAANILHETLVWDLARGVLRGRLDTAALDMKFSSDSRKLFIFSGITEMWDVKKMECVEKTGLLLGRYGDVTPNGRFVLCPPSIFRINSMTSVTRSIRQLEYVRFSPDAEYIISQTGTKKITRIEFNQETAQLGGEKPLNITCNYPYFSILSDISQDRLIATYGNEKVKMFNYKSEQEIGTLEPNQVSEAVAFSPKDGYFATAGSGVVRLWRASAKP
jgi:WD40 repeat protein